MMKKFIDRLFHRNEKLPEDVQNKIRDTLEGEGWKIIEGYMKRMISQAYGDLLLVKKSDLENRQMIVSTLIDVVQNIYDMAGLSWGWDKYTDVRNLRTMQDEEEAIIQKAKADYLEDIRPKGDLEGVTNG